MGGEIHAGSLHHNRAVGLLLNTLTARQLCEAREHSIEKWPETPNFFPMGARQFCQDIQCQGRQPQLRAPSVRIDDMAGHEPLFLQAIEQTRRTVRLQQ